MRELTSFNIEIYVAMSYVITKGRNFGVSKEANITSLYYLLQI